MTCEERRDAVFLYAAGELEPGEREAVRAHLSGGCPRCSGALAEAEAVLASIPLALAPIKPDPATKEKLMSRVRASAGVADTTDAAPRMKIAGTAPQPSRSCGRFTLGTLVTYSGIAAAIAAFIAGIAVKQNLQPKIDSLVSVRDILLAERMQMVSLADPANTGAATGRVYWDMDKGMWGVVVFNLKPPPAGKVYQLWAIPDGTGTAPMPMNTFTVNATGKAMFTQPVPTAATPIKVAAITMEPEGGSQTPTMPIQLMGAAN